MKIRYAVAATLTAATVACSNPVDTETPTAIALPPVTAAAVSGTVVIGNAVTVSDVGWKNSFGGTITVESDATVIYAVVFGGTGGAAPVSGVTVGSQALTKLKSVTGPNASSLDVYRLVTPATGSQAIAVTRSSLGYDPVRVTVFTVRGASVANPNGTMANVDLTPGTATSTRTVAISSSTGGLTISAVAASGSYLNGNGVTATPGFQSMVATGEDADGGWGVIGSAPGAASVTHSWNLKADAAGRFAFAVSFSINPADSGSTPTTPPPTTPPPTPPPPTTPTDGVATFGSIVTLSDNGWVQPFTGTIQVEQDAKVIYAVVFNGTGGNAPVNGISVGGKPLTKIKAAERTLNASLDVYRLVSPTIGAQTIAVTHSKLGYDPVRVSVFTVRGANVTTPNGAVTEVEITPASAIATRPVAVLSSSDGLTITAVAASGMYANGNGITATPGFQVTRSSGEDPDGLWGVLGSAPGAVSVTHSYDLRADAAGRSAYLVSFTVNGASGAPPPPPPPPPPTPLPIASDGFTTILDYDMAQIPPHSPANYQGWTAFERPWEQMLYTNLTQVTDATQPGGGSPNAARVTFLPSLPGGYAPVNFEWGGPWPSNTGSIDLTFTIKLSSNWDNNGINGGNDGIKLFFFGMQPQNNHFIAIQSLRYNGAEGAGTGTVGGAWVAVGLQNPTITYKTNMDLTRNVWHTIRMQVIANTPGVSNGQLRVWVDGVQAMLNTGQNDPPFYPVRSNVQFYSSGQTAKQNRLELEPTYGAGLQSPPYTQWFDIGHITAAIR